jgi:hypothetical protein
MRLVAIVVSLGLAVSLASHAIAEETPTSTNAQQQLLGQGELDALVAPIALYPDALLAQVLMASTYPLEVVQAERWAKANKSLKGDKLKEALTNQDWDASVKALVATPTVLSMINGDLDWLEKLGDAVLAQQPDLMDAIQRLRSKAQANGKLTTTKQQKVTVTQQADKQVIVIEPTSPESVYVPYYEPSVVYGTWPYEDYEPYYFPPAPGYIVGGALATGIAWGQRMRLATPSGIISIGGRATSISMLIRTLTSTGTWIGTTCASSTGNTTHSTDAGWVTTTSMSRISLPMATPVTASSIIGVATDRRC